MAKLFYCMKCPFTFDSQEKCLPSIVLIFLSWHWFNCFIIKILYLVRSENSLQKNSLQKVSWSNFVLVYKSNLYISWLYFKYWSLKLRFYLILSSESFFCWISSVRKKFWINGVAQLIASHVKIYISIFNKLF